MNRGRIILAVTAALALSSAALAQPYYLTGEVTNPAWSPGTGVPLGGGTIAEATFTEAPAGVFTLTVSEANSGFTAGTSYDYKVASFNWTAGDWPSSNARIFAPATTGWGSVTYTLNKNTLSDGFLPNTNIVYNSLDRVHADSATSIQATGTFQDGAPGEDVPGPGGIDWDPAAAGVVTLTDAGNTTTNDGIYQGTVTGLASGVYDFKVTTNQSFGAAAWGTAGLSSGGGNFSFTVLDPSNVITITLDANTSRVKAVNPAAVAGPPFYAQSSAWGLGFSSLEDMGAASGNIYSKVFTVPTAGNYSVRIAQGAGQSFPESGPYPFETTTNNQQVLVVFDRNTYADGYLPATDLVIVLDNATRVGLNTWSNVQAVGNWQTETGGSDWSNNDPAFNLADSGSAPDTAAGDGIYAAQFNVISAPAEANGEMKFVATPSYDGAADRWKYQFGGSEDTITQQGNNESVIFNYANGDKILVKVDTIAGRSAVATGATPTLGQPTRASYFSLTSVNEWSLY